MTCFPTRWCAWFSRTAIFRKWNNFYLYTIRTPPLVLIRCSRSQSVICVSEVMYKYIVVCVCQGFMTANFFDDIRQMEGNKERLAIRMTQARKDIIFVWHLVLGWFERRFILCKYVWVLLLLLLLERTSIRKEKYNTFIIVKIYIIIHRLVLGILYPHRTLQPS